jgi:hypothetical protein
MLATPKDFQASIAVVAIYAFFSILGAPKSIMNAVLSQGMIVRGAWVVAILGLAYFKFYMTAVLLAVLGLRISLDVRSSYVLSTESIMAQYSELQKNDPRFNGSMDAELADGTLPLDPARWMDPGRSPVPLLLFPPSLDQLEMVQSNSA